MVDTKLRRIRVLCPKGHEVITRKQTHIQCRKCAVKGINSRFGVLPKSINTTN